MHTHIHTYTLARLLWGGLGTAELLSQEDAKTRLQSEMCMAYPSLSNARIDYVWGGAMSWGLSQMPLIGQIEPNCWYASAFGGHGLVPTAVAGDLIVSAIVSEGKDDRYTRWEAAFPPKVCGRVGVDVGVGAGVRAV